MPAHHFPTLSERPLPDAGHYGLLPKAFDPPAPITMPSWLEGREPVSFRPPQPGAHGHTIHSFDEFRADPLFTISQQEMARQLDGLRSTAQGWRSGQGDQVAELLQVIKFKLLLSSGPAIGKSLEVIHGAGKRGLDEFCALMREPTIDESARRCALVNLAEDLAGCGPRIGSTLSDAPQTLLLAQGGLHAALYQRNKRTIEQALVTAWREVPCRPQDPDYTEDMEVHGVLQLRRELGLPGQELEDLFAQPRLVTREMIAFAQRLVEDRLDPSAMAREMAVDVLQDLHAGLRKKLGEDLSRIDPLGDEHDVVRDALKAINLRYGGIRLQSIVTAHDDCTRGTLATDPSLVTLDLLDKMAQSGLAPEPRCYPIVSWSHADGQTSLSHVDRRIFFLEHRSPARGDIERSPVTLASLAHVPASDTAPSMPGLRDRGRPLGPWREHLAATLIQGLPQAELVDFPRDWLTHDALTTALLTRMTPAQRETWLAKRPLPQAIAAVVARMAEADRKEREKVLVRHFREAVDTRDPARLSDAMRQLHDQPQLLAMLLQWRPTRRHVPPLRQAMVNGDQACAELLLGAIHVLSEQQYLTPRTEQELLREGMSDEALAHPHIFPAWLLAVDATVKAGRMTADEAGDLVTRRGDFAMDAVYWSSSQYPEGALRGWVGLVSQARRLGVIARAFGLQTLRAPRRAYGSEDVSFLFSIRHRRDSARLRELLDGYVDAARRGHIDRADLMSLLGEVADGPTLLRTGPWSSENANAHEHLEAFMDAALAGALHTTLTSDDYLALVQRQGLAVPMLSSLCHPLEKAGLDVFLKKLVIASAVGVLPVESLRAMLLAKTDGRQPDIAGASAPTKQRLLATVDHLADGDLIDAGRAVQWKKDIAKLADTPWVPGKATTANAVRATRTITG